MKIILIQDLEGYGTFGDIVNVRDGFANNYLIPRGIAIPATDGNIKHIESVLQQRRRKLQKEREKALALAEKLKGVELEIQRQVGEKGKLFGSITASDISNALKEKGLEIDRKRIILKNPIKDVGLYTIGIKLHPEVIVDIKLNVVPAK